MNIVLIYKLLDNYTAHLNAPVASTQGLSPKQYIRLSI